jgi:hypothetical protein
MPGPFSITTPIKPPPTATSSQQPIDTTPWISEAVDAAVAERFQQLLCLEHMHCPDDPSEAEPSSAQPVPEEAQEKADWRRAFAPHEAATLAAQREADALYWRTMEQRYPYLASKPLESTPPSEPQADPAPGPYTTPLTIPSPVILMTPATQAQPTHLPGRDATAVSPTKPTASPSLSRWDPRWSTMTKQPRIEVDLGPLRPAEGLPSITPASGEVGGEPMGPRSVNQSHVKSDQKTSVRNENSMADQLAREGYRVIQNPRIPPEQMTEQGLDSEKNPDFIIEGRVFDLYTPIVTTASQVYLGIAKKINDGQTDRVVVDLRHTQTTRAELEAELKTYPIEGLKEVITVTEYGVGHAFPK